MRHFNQNKIKTVGSFNHILSNERDECSDIIQQKSDFSGLGQTAYDCFLSLRRVTDRGKSRNDKFISLKIDGFEKLALSIVRS